MRAENGRWFFSYSCLNRETVFIVANVKRTGHYINGAAIAGLNINRMLAMMWSKWSRRSVTTQHDQDNSEYGTIDYSYENINLQHFFLPFRTSLGRLLLLHNNPKEVLHGRTKYWQFWYSSLLIIPYSQLLCIVPNFLFHKYCLLSCVLWFVGVSRRGMVTLKTVVQSGPKTETNDRRRQVNFGWQWQVRKKAKKFGKLIW